MLLVVSMVVIKVSKLSFSLFFMLFVITLFLQVPVQVKADKVKSKTIYTKAGSCPLESYANTAILVRKDNLSKKTVHYVASLFDGEKGTGVCTLSVPKGVVKTETKSIACQVGESYNGKTCMYDGQLVEVDTVSREDKITVKCTVARKRGENGGSFVSVEHYIATSCGKDCRLALKDTKTDIPVENIKFSSLKERDESNYKTYLTKMGVGVDDIGKIKSGKAAALVPTGGYINGDKLYNSIGCHIYTPHYKGGLYRYLVGVQWEAYMPRTGLPLTLLSSDGKTSVSVTTEMLRSHFEKKAKRLGSTQLSGIQIIYAEDFATFCPTGSTYAGTKVGSTVNGKKIKTTKDCNVYCPADSDKGKSHLLTLSELNDITKACKLYACPTYTGIEGTSKTKYLLKEKYANGKVHKVANEEDCYWRCETKQNVLKGGVSSTSKILIADMDVSSVEARNRIRDNYCFARCPVQEDSDLLVVKDKAGKLLKQKNGDKSEEDCYARCKTKKNTLKKGISDNTKIPTAIGLTLDEKRWNKIRDDYCFIRCPDDASKNPHKLLPKGERAEVYCNVQTKVCLEGTRKAGKKIPKGKDATWCDLYCDDGSVVPLDVKDGSNDTVEKTKAFYCKVRFCPKPNNKQKLGSGFKTKKEVNNAVKLHCKASPKKCPPNTRRKGQKIPKGKDTTWCDIYCPNDKSRVVPTKIAETDKKGIAKFCNKPITKKCPPNSDKPNAKIPQGTSPIKFCWKGRIDCHNVPSGVEPPPHCKLGFCGYDRTSSASWPGGGSYESDPIPYNYPLYDFAKTVDVKTETVTGTYMVYAEIRPVFPANFSSLPQEEQDYWKKTHITVQTVPVLTEYGQYILENRDVINELSGLHKAGGVGNSSDYARTWREIYQNALALSKEPIPEVELQFENEDTILGNERGGLYTYTEYRSTITISSGTKQDYYYRNGCQIDTGSSGGGGMGGGSNQSWTRNSHARITKEICCNMQGEKISGLRTISENQSFSGEGGYSYYNRRVTMYIGEVEDPVIIDGEYTVNAKVTLDPTFRPYTSYQTLTVRCNKDRFLDEIGRVGGTVLHSSNATSTGRSPNVSGRIATFFDGLGVDFFYKGKTCDNLYGCVGEKNHVANHDGKNNISSTIENALGKFGAQTTDEDGEQKVSSVFSFFRDNISHPVRNDVWWLKKNVTSPEITIDNSEEADATFYTLDRNGTPTDQLFYFEDKDKNVITNGADLKNLKNAWYVNGQENLFHWRGKWATENGKPHQMNIKYAYKPVITTTNIQTFSRNGVTTEKTESPIDMVCEVRFNTNKSYKPIIFNKPRPWVYAPFRIFDNTEAKKMQVNFVKSSKE